MFYILIGVCLFLYWIWCNRSSTLEPPVLSGRLPIIGHALLGFGDGVRMFKHIQNFTKESQEKGGVFRAFIGPATLYGITDAEDALTVSNVCLQKHFIYNVAKPLLKNGLVTADVHTWKKNRKLLNPAFTPQVIMSLLDTFNNQARRLVEKLAKEEGKAFDHEIIVRMNNLETICMTSFGADAQEFGELQTNYINHLDTVGQIVDQRFRQVWLAVDFIYRLTPLKKKLDRSAAVLATLADSIIKKKLDQMKYTEMKENDTEQLTTFSRTILKVASEGNMTDEEVRSEIDTIIAAGHDTVSGAVTIALTLLGSYPDVQEKMYHEIIQVVGESDRNFGKDDVAQLVYMDAFIKETLRLYPVIPVIGREISQDIKLKNYTLKPKFGGGCFISIHGVLRDKIWGADPHEFRPERWLDKDSIPDPKYFAAFGIGRRSCIGKQYSMTTIKVTLAHVLRQYKISSDVSKMVIRSNFVLKPVSGHEITLQKRKQL